MRIVTRPKALSAGWRAMVKPVIDTTATMKIQGAHGHPGTGTDGPSRSRKRTNPPTAAAVLRPSVKTI